MKQQLSVLGRLHCSKQDWLHKSSYTVAADGTLGIRRFSADLSLCSVAAASFCRAGEVPVFLHAELAVLIHTAMFQLMLH